MIDPPCICEEPFTGDNPLCQNCNDAGYGADEEEEVPAPRQNTITRENRRRRRDMMAQKGRTMDFDDLMGASDDLRKERKENPSHIFSFHITPGRSAHTGDAWWTVICTDEYGTVGGDHHWVRHDMAQKAMCIYGADPSEFPLRHDDPRLR